MSKIVSILSCTPPLIKLNSCLLSKLNAPILANFGSNSAHNRKGCAAALGCMILNLGRPCSSLRLNLHLLLVPGLGRTDNDDLVDVHLLHGLQPRARLDRLGVTSLGLNRGQGVSTKRKLAVNVLTLLVIKRVAIIHIELTLSCARLGG